MARRPLIRLVTAPALAGCSRPTVLTAAPAVQLPPRQLQRTRERVRRHAAPPPRPRPSWKPRPEQYTQTSRDQGPRDPDVRRREAARRPDPPGQRGRQGDRRQGAGRRDHHGLQQDRHRRRLRRHAGRRRPGVPRQARLRPAHRRRPRHRLERGPVERLRQPREQGRRRGDDLGAQAAVEQRQHRDDRRLLHGHQPDLRRRRQARRASRRSSRRCPAADVYRDVVASGGQIDSGFMPLWLGLVTATGLVPPAVGDHRPAVGDRRDGLAASVRRPRSPARPWSRRSPARSTAYDGPFYAERSPINVIDKVNVPTFLVAGEYDLFQRGTPLLFESCASAASRPR